MSETSSTTARWVSTVRTVAGGAADPAGLFAHLYGDRPVAVWLDSARSAYGMGRWSVLGAPETEHDRMLEVGASGGDPDGPDPWSLLAERLAEHTVDPIGELPFAGGYVGYIGYGAKTIGGTAPPGAPVAQLVHISRFILLDHVAGDAVVVAVGPERDTPEAHRWVGDAVRRIEAVGLDRGAPIARNAVGPPARPADRPHGGSATPEQETAAGVPGTARSRGAGRHEPPSPGTGPRTAPLLAEASVSRETYLADVGEVRRWLYDGDSYEACYTYNLRLPYAGDALAAYLRLRAANPAPNAAFLRLPGRDVLSCSPERFLRVSPDGSAETKPIKGTARRESDSAADALAAERLAADPKTRAENLMIVDLMRNDLVPVSEPGSVEVPQLMAVESYETVHQLVTTVRSRLRRRETAGVRAAEALFPPGSMTGAPKQRSVELLDGLEAEPRGVYSGVLGLFSRDGAVDLSVIIRTAVVEAGAATIGTGGAITFDSDPEAELQETIAKSRAILRAFGAAHPFEE